MFGKYNYLLVAISLVLSIGASFVALSLAVHIKNVSKPLAKYWLIGGGVSMGLGIWVMHFVGMIAFHLPIPVAYDVSLTLLSMFFAIAASILTLATVNSGQSSGKYLYLSTFLMGSGVASMHYIGMEALDMFPAIQYKPSLFATSLVIAYAASFVALKLAFKVSLEREQFFSKQRFYASLVMGMGIGAMHYTGMAAAVIQAGTVCRSLPDGIDVGVMSMLIVLGVIIILSFTFLVLVFDITLDKKDRQYIDSLETLNEELQQYAVNLSHENKEKTKLATELKSYIAAINQHAIVSVADSSGKITEVNDKFCEVSGYSRNELLGQDHRIVNSGRHPKSFFIDLWTTISSGNKWHGEICNRSKNGSLYWVDSTIIPVNDDDGNIDYYVSVRINITESKIYEAELIASKQEAESANNAKSDFLSSMSHELRTPLNAILGFSQLIKMNTKEELTKINSQEIITGGEHLVELINQVLDLSKIESGFVDLSIKSHNFNKIFNDTMSLIKPIADKYSIQICNKVDPLSGVNININVDETGFKQVLLNILTNAIKYNTENGKVTIDCPLNNGKMFCLSVTDSGKGLTAEQQIKIFLPFDRAGLEGSNIEGTGLGLVISKKLIEQMGGTITAESEIGKGSCFLIQVPLS